MPARPEHVAGVGAHEEVDDRGRPEPLGVGDVAGGVDEACELLVGHLVDVDAERAHRDGVHRRLPVVAVPLAEGVAHPERPAVERDVLMLDRLAVKCVVRWSVGGRETLPTRDGAQQ